jgi:hypothetical protein
MLSASLPKKMHRLCAVVAALWWRYLRPAEEADRREHKLPNRQHAE